MAHRRHRRPSKISRRSSREELSDTVFFSLLESRRRRNCAVCLIKGATRFSKVSRLVSSRQTVELVCAALYYLYGLLSTVSLRAILLTLVTLIPVSRLPLATYLSSRLFLSKRCSFCFPREKQAFRPVDLIQRYGQYRVFY